MRVFSMTLFGFGKKKKQSQKDEMEYCDCGGMCKSSKIATEGTETEKTACCSGACNPE